MPQVGLHCIKGDVPHQDCRACALCSLHPCMLTPDLLERLRETRGRGVVFSPTRLLGCHRRQVLERSVDYYSDVEDSYPLLRGNLIHQAMESTRYPGVEAVIREQQLWTTVQTCFGPQRFESTPDLIVVQRVESGVAHLKIVDYKSKNEIGHDLVAPLPDHVAQLNMYAWLVTRALPAVLGLDGVVVDEVELMYIGSNKPRRFTSAGPLQTRGKLLTRKPRTYATLTLAAVPLWPVLRTERGIVRHIERMLTPSETLPPVLPEDKQWVCNYCPVAATCWATDKKERDAA